MASLNLRLSGLEAGATGPGDVSGFSVRALNDGWWHWDKLVRVCCRNNCASQNNCSFRAYVKDGVVLGQELAADYPPRNDLDVPDANPRGCQKGMVLPDWTYHAARAKYPLKRVGQRGEGRWQRLSWEQALTEIADTLIDVITTDGPETVHFAGASEGEGKRAEDTAYVSWARALDIPSTAMNAEVGDERPGTAICFGKIALGSSADNYFYTNLILQWGGNPAYTAVSYYHFTTEARYHGTRVITISPDYSPSAVHADLWVPVNMGTDAALALTMAQVIISNKLYKDDFVREQTDLPLLVREDTRKFLRESDIKRDGKSEVFYFYDEASRQVVEAPWRSLALDGRRPALEGQYEVETLTGRVKVKPVFERLKRELADYTPQKASAITGVSPHLVEQLAREIASVEGVMYCGAHNNWGKMYHGDLIERAMILVFALCGHLGRKGANFSGQGSLAPDYAIGAVEQRGDQMLLGAASSDPRHAEWQKQGYTDEMIIHEYTRDAFASGHITPSAVFYYVHAGLLDLSDRHYSWDPYLQRLERKPGDYLREALAKGWHNVMPRMGKDPKIMFSMGGNFLKRVRGTQVVIDTLLPKLKMLVVVDPRMCSSAMYADYVLPACGWHEKYTMNMLGPGLHPYWHLSSQCVDPLYDSKNEWEIFCLLAKAMQERAIARGIVTFVDRAGKERRLDNLYEQVTAHGLYSEDTLEDVVRDMFTNTSNVEQMDWEEFKERGYAEFTSVGRSSRSMGHATDFTRGEPIIALKHHVEKKKPYPTTTRRIQFYIDHEWYLELGEELPVQKEDPKAGGDYPLRMTSGHARWSIHSTHVDDALLLRLQRGEPIMFMSAQDARQRGVVDGEEVEVFNDVASFRTHAAVSASPRPGQVIVYHSWENYQFPEKKHFKSVQPTPLNPVECAGGYHHLRPLSASLMPGHSDRETRVEVRKTTS